jgi:hypothetical protein
MSKIETQLEINGVTYSGKDLDLICLGMSLKQDSIIKLLEDEHKTWHGNDNCWCSDQIEVIKGEQ